MKRLFFFLFALFAVAFAKDAPKQVIAWPSAEKTLIRFSVLKVSPMGSGYGSEKVFSVEVLAENLSGEAIPKASFSAFFFDKNNVRVADGPLLIEHARPSESIRVILTVAAGASPVKMELTPVELPASWKAPAPPKKVSITVYSVPAGASLKVDGAASGVTPVAISVTPGAHMLEFAKEGFSPGSFPLHIGNDQLSGGQVSYELGASAHDTVELRDGNVITCDVQSVTAREVLITMGGAQQTLDRNNVKRIIFTVRN
jgi:hypothetical protein